MKTSEYKNLLLSNSYQFAFAQYERILSSKTMSSWDYIFITAANEEQAESYRRQIAQREETGRLPHQSRIIVLSDEGGKRIGSGGATLQLLRFLFEEFGFTDFFETHTCLLLHSGGDSRRIAQYSVCGKLFMPVPHNDARGERLTLFDEILAMTSCIPAKMQGGLLVLTGDVLLICNPLQITVGSDDAVAVTAKESWQAGEKHGVFVKDTSGAVLDFLHKQPLPVLERHGAVDGNGEVDIDTGAVILRPAVLAALFALLCEQGRFSLEKYQSFVNDTVRLNFYGDFLYPMARQARLADYLQMPHEAADEKQLRSCREALFAVLHPFSLRASSLSPATFFHLGTTAGLQDFLSVKIEEYACFGWKRCLHTNVHTDRYAANNALISEHAEIGKDSYIEDSILAEAVRLGKGCVVSNVTLRDICVPDNTVLHGVKLSNGNFVVRVYPAQGNVPWEEALFPVRGTCEQAARDALEVIHGGVLQGEAHSLHSSAAQADMYFLAQWPQQVADAVYTHILLQCAKEKTALQTVKSIFCQTRFHEQRCTRAERIALESEPELRMRLLYYLSHLVQGENRQRLEDACFETIRSGLGMQCTALLEGAVMQKEEVTHRLPLRVNWGGGWSDTPPYCIFHGGTVLNAAITLDGEEPVEVIVRRLEEPVLRFVCADMGIQADITDLKTARDCSNALDDFSLHKAVIQVLGLLPEQGRTLQEILAKMGGGLYLSTAAYNVPRGSGLGTSSILLVTCVQAICSLFGIRVNRDACMNLVLCAEQLMHTGGGWQDQMAALAGGMQLITSVSGFPQKMTVKTIHLLPDALEELSQRFCLVYTGQQRLARTILQDVMGKYLSCEERYIQAFKQIQELARQMTVALENADIDYFAQLLDQHWEYSKLLDESCTNESIERILSVCGDMLDGRMICGAGGGGFLQVVLKKRYTKDDLNQRLCTMFPGSEITVYGSAFKQK